MERSVRELMLYELVHLAEHRAMLEQLKLDLIDCKNDLSPLPSEWSKGNLPSDPTGAKATRHVLIKEKIYRLQTRIRRVEIAIEALHGCERRLIELRYLDVAGYNNDQVAAMLQISQKHYYNMRTKAMDKMIDVVGLSRITEWQEEKLQ